jgi:Fe2+ or Zn2+ uptake regulation protein
MNIFCKHKYSTIDSNGIQYCTKCGKARQIKLECNHHWELINTVKVEITNRMYGTTQSYFKYVLKCKHCGEIKIKKTR